MPRKARLEDRFVEALEKGGVSYDSKIFYVGNKLYLPDFVFGGLIVEISEELTPKRLELIKKFRKADDEHKIYLLTEDTKHAVEFAEFFDEVFDYASMNVLMSQIKKFKG